MTELRRDILQCTGHPSMLPLRKLVPRARMLKLESENPTGNTKGPHGLGHDRSGRGTP